MRTFIETENGFVNANFCRGQRLPETLWYNETTAQTFTLNQTETILQLLESNCVEVRRVVYVR